MSVSHAAHLANLLEQGRSAHTAFRIFWGRQVRDDGS